VAAEVRHHLDQADPDRLVRISHRFLGTGLAVVILFLLGAVVSGRMSPLARRPLLDGFAPPPPYRWASPPPDLASSNKPPASGSFTIALDPLAGSEANVFSTNDLQASLALSAGAIAPMTGKESVALRIEPLAPDPFGPAPAGLSIVGNVYRVEASYTPGGPAVTTLKQPGQLTLFYPASPDNLFHNHTILYSSDGRAWRALATTDSQAQQQATAKVIALGYFTVGQSGKGTPKPFPIGRVIYYLVLGSIVLALVVAFVRSEWRDRRERRRSALGKRGR